MAGKETGREGARERDRARRERSGERDWLFIAKIFVDILEIFCRYVGDTL